MKKTNRILVLILLAILISIQFCNAQQNKTEDKNVEITYIANEGFLINVGEKSILIDAIFGDKEYGFCDIPDSVQIASMLEAKELYMSIDLIAVTHKDIANFYAPFVSEHLSNNKEGKLISSEQTIEKLSRTNNYEEIKGRLIKMTPDDLSFQDTVINGIGIKAFRLKHGPHYIVDSETGEKSNRHKNTQNLGFLFDINGIKIFHSGGSNPTCISDYEHFRLEKEDIDIAFLGRDFIWNLDSEVDNVVRDYINPKHIIIMNIYHKHNERFIKLAKKANGNDHSVKVFANKMESKRYTIE